MLSSIIRFPTWSSVQSSGWRFYSCYKGFFKGIMISHCKDPYKPTRISWNVTKVGFERYTHMHQFHRMLKHQPEGTSKTLGQSRWPWVNLQLLVCNAYNPNQHHWEHAQNSWITNLNPPTIDGRIAPWKITWQILLVQVFFSGEIAPGNFSVKKPMFFFPICKLAAGNHFKNTHLSYPMFLFDK